MIFVSIYLVKLSRLPFFTKFICLIFWNGGSVELFPDEILFILSFIFSPLSVVCRLFSSFQSSHCLCSSEMP